jgi:signal transduction histidine kinase/HAMP domain-containing protein
MPIINERYSSSLNKMFLIVIISASIIITLISFDIRANVTGPIAKLRDVVLKISEGDFRSKVAIKTKNEIGRLGEAFNKMTAMLEAYRKQLTQKIDELSVLNEVGREFASTIEFEKILRLIISKVTEIMQVEAGSLLLIDEDSGDLIFSVVAGEKRKLLEGMRLKMGEGIPGWVAKEGQILLVPDTSKDERFNPEIDRLTGFRTRSVLCVPMKLKAKTIGAIDVINPPQEDFFVGKDITLLKTLADQAAIVINNAKLYRQAQEQLIQLKETQAQLVQAGKLAAVGELAAGVAHELNNPLSSVLLYCQHLLRKLGSEGKIDHDKHPHYLKEIEKAALRGREIVSGLLKFSRQERGDFSDIEVNEVVEDALSLTSYRLEKSNIEVRKELCPDLPRVKGNSNYLQQVVANIILNAIQAMPDDGILGIKTEYDRDIEEVKVFISDTGCGIPDDIKDKIFDPFFTTKKEGTGLGLSISYGIVRDHGGRIEVESKVDSGTTLAVVLPAVGRLQKRRQLKSGKDFSSRG